MIEKAAEIIQNAEHVTAFTGAGISVESGIPPFRGPNGLWNKYNPRILDISYFRTNPEDSWHLIKEIFYDFFGQAKPNPAHIGLAEMEDQGYIDAVITQNIDNLHQEAGSSKVYEFHGNSREMVCTNCKNRKKATKIDLDQLPPSCNNCGQVYKPDFIFFGEAIPEPARTNSFKEAEIADVFLIIGSTGEVVPASQIPFIAKRNGASIIEINTNRSNFTREITDVFLQGKASKMVDNLVAELS
ncbi:MAG TPA: NAD-dependent deacylase [bacterium]|nr:NAD-dependent deacylase [bacterium]